MKTLVHRIVNNAMRAITVHQEAQTLLKISAHWVTFVPMVLNMVHSLNAKQVHSVMYKGCQLIGSVKGVHQDFSALQVD